MTPRPKDHDSLIRLEEKLSSTQKSVEDIHALLKEYMPKTQRHDMNLRVVNWVGGVLLTTVLGLAVHALAR